MTLLSKSAGTFFSNSSGSGNNDSAGISAGQQTLLQARVPDHLRGRVFGAYETTGTLALLLGLGVGGALGDAVGTVPLLTFGGVLWSVAGLVVRRVDTACSRTKEPAQS